MLRFVLHADHRQTMLPYLDGWAGDFRSRVEILSYDELFRAARVRACLHVFTDLERLAAEYRELAAQVWNALERAAPGVRQLNHPLRAMRRYELLRTLHERGINDFDVYRLTEGRSPKRYPVFIRGENDHAGPQTELLATAEALEDAVAGLCREGKSRDARIVVEFHAEPGADGCYRKYSAFFVDGDVIPRHIMFAHEWMVKARTKVIDDAKLAEERDYMDRNPHAAWIRTVFEIAHIDYGRIDYGFVGGRPQVFEINTNPTIIPAGPGRATPRNERFTAALTRAFATLEAKSGGNGSAGLVALERPLKSWPGRLANRVLAALVKRQLRAPI